MQQVFLIANGKKNIWQVAVVLQASWILYRSFYKDEGFIFLCFNWLYGEVLQWAKLVPHGDTASKRLSILGQAASLKCGSVSLYVNNSWFLLVLIQKQLISHSACCHLRGTFPLRKTFITFFFFLFHFFIFLLFIYLFLMCDPASLIVKIELPSSMRKH